MPAPFEPSAHSYPSQRLQLNYWDWGNADKPLLLLIHGGEDHARSWDRVALALRDDWHVVAPDLRGHGDSAWSPDGAYVFEHLVCDIANLVDHLGEKPLTIVAHSFGGAISLRYAGLFPANVRRLVAIEGLASVPGNTGLAATERLDLWRKWIGERQDFAPRTPRRVASVEAGAARMAERNPHLTPDMALHLARWGMRDYDGQLGWKFDPYFRAFQPMDASDIDRTAFWSAIDCPVLLFHGKESWAKNPDEDGRVTHFRNARVISWERAGHWLHHDRLDDFVAEVRSFLAD